MSLWTPGGEVPVGRNRPADDTSAPTTQSSGTGRSGGGESPAASSSDAGAAGLVGGPDLDELGPEERAQAEAMIAQMADVQRQIMSAPAAQFVTNHVVGLYELGAIHLNQPEPDIDEARLAIDAMGAVLDVAEARLGEDGRSLRDALTQLQMVFVQLTSAVPGTTAAPPEG